MTDSNSASSTPWKLIVTAGPDRGRVYVVADQSTLLIGRGSDSDTKILDPRLSRLHCELRRSGDTFEIKDRNGAGGTFVDGSRVDNACEMTPQSMLRIGDSELRLQRDSILDMATMVPDKSSRMYPTQKPMTFAINQILDLEGETFLRFRLDKLVSTGQNSVMFKGVDIKRDRDVAVKILKPQMATTDVQRDRFIRAMRTMLPVKHPNIVRTRKAGRTGPYCWAAFDWVDGISVRELIEKIGIGGMLDWKEVYRVAVHIGRALEEASKHRIVHRNVTPSNLIRRKNDQAFLLTDLIFARALEYTDVAQLTCPGEVVGELGYIAPERIFDATRLDALSDQYSLGATLYALLTGHPPYVAVEIGELIETIRSTEPRSPVESQMGLDERFCDVVMRMIQKSETARFSSPTILLRELQQVGRLAGIESEWAQWD